MRSMAQPRRPLNSRDSEDGISRSGPGPRTTSLSSTVPVATITRKALLVVVIVALLAASQLLAYISDNDNIEPFWGSLSGMHPVWWTVNVGLGLVLPVVLFVRGWRGSARAFEVLAAISVVFGTGCVVGALFATHGPFTLAAVGLIQIAVSVVFWLLRWEILDEKDRLASARWRE
jgi:hypothetical protein